MKRTKLLTPDFIFESSWEVCNKVGGIYTVLSTRAKTLQSIFENHLFFIGPDLWKSKVNPLFHEDKRLFSGWKKKAQSEGLFIRIGHWNIPGTPLAILVDFTPFYETKNTIYAQMWEDFKVDSLHAYGDYDEASMFSYAAGKVVESFYLYHHLQDKRVVYQAHEWMTGLGALYIRKEQPDIATIFTTHATTIGRSIAGNHKPLYDYLAAYNGDQMSYELNVASKHSIEKQTAHHVDCFTTVSDITAHECRELLDKYPDAILMNGFEDDFVPQKSTLSRERKASREKLLSIARTLTGKTIANDALIIGISGRYEYKNKGIDLYIEALNRLRHDARCHKEVVAFITVPAWAGEKRSDLSERLQSNQTYDTALPEPFITHQLHNADYDSVLNALRHFQISNEKNDLVNVVFIPCYLDGNDDILNMEYYNVLSGMDMTIYPSYYEPWGYTPLESIAFKVPTITTNLSGFGQWVNKTLKHQGDITNGVEVIERTDNNYDSVAEHIKETVLRFMTFSKEDIEVVRQKAGALSKKALWKHFITYYYQAYDIALNKAIKRNIEN